MTKSASTILLEDSSSFSEYKTYDIFLSHSSKDADVIYALKKDLEGFNYSVYVDWIEDPDMDRSKVNPDTAKRLQKRMDACSCLLYATSPNASNSKWMPWELGYLDGKKQRVAILPISDTITNSNIFTGQEYLGIYPYITKEVPKNSTIELLWVQSDLASYVEFDSWLKYGSKPYKH